MIILLQFFSLKIMVKIARKLYLLGCLHATLALASEFLYKGGVVMIKSILSQ